MTKEEFIILNIIYKRGPNYNYIDLERYIRWFNLLPLESLKSLINKKLIVQKILQNNSSEYSLTEKGLVEVKNSDIKKMIDELFVDSVHYINILKYLKLDS